MEAAASQVHDAWMQRNPKSDWNAACHVPYGQLPEEEKEKDRAQVRLTQQLISEHPRSDGETDAAHAARIADAFGALAHEDWRRTHEESKGKGTPRMKDVSDGGPQVNINVPWSELHSEWKKENFAAGLAAVAAVQACFK